jgi:hypothetical protein
MGRGKSAKTQLKLAEKLAYVTELAKIKAQQKANEKKKIEVSARQHIGKFLDKPDVWSKGIEAVMLAALAGLSYEAGKTVKHIEEHWEWDIPLKQGETRSTADHIGMHLVQAHDEVTHHPQDLLLGPLGYLLAVKSNGLPSQIAGLAILTAVGVCSAGYVGYEPPKGSIIDIANNIARGLNQALGLPI